MCQVASHISLLATVGVTTVVWVAAVYLGPATDPKVLDDFYRLVRPAGPGWTAVRARTGIGASPDSIPQAMLGWVFGVLFVYAALFGVGSFLAGRTALMQLWAVVFVVSGAGALRVLKGFWRAA